MSFIWLIQDISSNHVSSVMSAEAEVIGDWCTDWLWICICMSNMVYSNLVWPEIPVMHLHLLHTAPAALTILGILQFLHLLNLLNIDNWFCLCPESSFGSFYSCIFISCISVTFRVFLYIHCITCNSCISYYLHRIISCISYSIQYCFISFYKGDAAHYMHLHTILSPPVHPYWDPGDASIASIGNVWGSHQTYKKLFIPRRHIYYLKCLLFARVS